MIPEVNLRGSDLSKANLVGCTLTMVDITGAFLRGADLSDSIIICPIYGNLTVDKNTKLDRAIIDDPNFIDELGLVNNVPEKILSRRELKIKLLERIKDEESVVRLLSLSKLPD